MAHVQTSYSKVLGKSLLQFFQLLLKLKLIVKSLWRVLAPGVVVLVLGACGQTGSLYLPTGPEAQKRASLPESLLPGKMDASDREGVGEGEKASPRPAPSTKSTQSVQP